MTVWSTSPVPQAWRGLWRRVALERADGSGDVTSLVLWLQTEHLFVDLRIPAARPHESAFAPSLAMQEGFAGSLRHQGDCAAWERRIDYQPLKMPDEGRLTRDRRMMVEHGLHDDYVEHWWLEADGDDLEVIADTPRLVAVRCHEHLMFARERRGSVPFDLPAHAATADDLPVLLDCEIAYATRDAAGWRIVASTLPWTEGRVIAAHSLHDYLTS